MNKQLHIKVFKPPLKWEEFALKHNVDKVCFIKNHKPNSVNTWRFKNKIYLNIGIKDWKVYKKILQINSQEEALTCKFLHEIGHILHDHKDLYPGVKVEKHKLDFEIAINLTQLKEILNDKEENQAWEYAKEFKQRYYLDYFNLVKYLKEWKNNHVLF